jgi:hypothetical protein
MPKKKRLQRDKDHVGEITQQANREPKPKEDWVPLQLPSNFDEMLDTMASSTEDRVGWCLMCNQPFRTSADLLPGTSTHNCEAGRALEAQIASSSRRTAHRPRKAGRLRK